MLLEALRNIYRKQFNATEDIEPHFFHEFTEIFNQAADEGFSQSVEPDEEFRKALRHNNAVFAAFKTHRLQNDMAAQLLDSNGNLKPFEQWRNDVQSIASHQCRSWFQTEYDTAVLRAHQAADWQQFMQEADVLPNLKWMPSTSPNPGADHMPFWGTILPIDDPFWDQHRPGDRWNCKCSLTSTDEPPTPVPSVAVSQQPKNTPQRGLENNPGKDAAVFSDKHPYFPNNCNACPFYKPGFKARLRTIFTNRAKDCYNCPYINGCINDIGKAERIKANRAEYERLLKDSNYKDVKFDEKTGGVKATHKGHLGHDPNDKQRFFGNLTNKDLESECQNLLYKWGHRAILRDEGGLLRIAEHLPALDLEIDGVIMDIRSITERTQYGGQLAAKNKQLGNIKRKTGLESDSICLYFHEPSLFSEEKLYQDIQWYKNFIIGVGSIVRIKHIYCVIQGADGVKRYDI